MIVSYADDWATRPTEPLSSLLAERLADFVQDSLADAGAYFVFLGQLVRGSTATSWRDRAIQVALTRLAETSERGAFLAAIDVAAERFSDALFKLNADRGSAEVVCDLLEARDDIESLRALVTLTVTKDLTFERASTVDALIEASNKLAFEIDAMGESHDAIESVLSILSTQPPRRVVRRLDGLRVLDVDAGGWWLSVIVRSKYRVQLRAAAQAIPDTSDVLLSWIKDHVALDFDNRSVESAIADWKSEVSFDWSDPKQLEVLATDLMQLLDGDYQPKKNDRVVRRATGAMRAISDAARLILKEGAARSRRRQLAHIVTFCMTMIDRLQGGLAEGARLPKSPQHVSLALDAWRTAHLLEDHVAIQLGRTLERCWPQKPSGSIDALVRGSVALTLQLSRQSDNEAALSWLHKGEALARKSRTAFMPLIIVAGGFIEVAKSMPPREGLALFRTVEDLAVECRERANRSGATYLPFFELRAAVVRGTLLDAIGDPLGAEAARREGLNVVRELAGVDGHRRYSVFVQETQLRVDLGEIRGAAQAMETYEQERLHESNRFRSRAAATAVKYRRALFLVAHGYHVEGIRVLSELSKRGLPPWRSHAAAALAYPQSLGIAGAEVRLALGAEDDWNALEQRAQRAFRHARRVAGTESESVALEDALRANKELLDRNRTDVIAITREAQLLTLRGTQADLVRAESILRELPLETRLRDEYVLGCFGHLEYRQKRFDTAAEFFRTAYEVAPSTETATMLARALTRLGRAGEALHTLAAHSVDDAPALHAEGIALIDRGDNTAAWKSLEKACSLLADDPDASPVRLGALARRLAVIAEKVAASDRSLVFEFLKRDMRYVAAFTNACMSRFSFSPHLRDVLLDAGEATTSLRFVLAKYAMGGAIYLDTHGSSDEAREWLSVMWDRLELRRSSLLIAELLAGAKSLYTRAVRSAFDGEPTIDRCKRYGSWLTTVELPNAELLEHIASTKQNANYYRGAADLVAADERLCIDKSAFLDQAIGIISHVRRASIQALGLERHLTTLAGQRSKNDQIMALWQASDCVGPTPDIFAASDLGLDGSVLLRATGATLRLLIALQEERPKTELGASGVKLAWTGQPWSDVCFRVLDADELSPSRVNAHVIVPYATETHGSSEASN